MDPRRRMINSRAKGQRGEREWVEYFKQWWPFASRGLSQTAGASTPDVDRTPFWVECKSGKRINLFAAYEQAKSDLAKEQKKGRYLDMMPIVCARQDRKDGVVMMSAETFAEVLELAYPQPKIPHEEVRASMVDADRPPWDL